MGLMSRMARCFVDHRPSRYVEHTVEDLAPQRTYALASGYEDLDDHGRSSRPGLGASRSGRPSRCEAGQLRLLPTAGCRETILRMKVETQTGAGGQAGRGRCC